MVDLGWEQNLLIFVTYCFSGGSLEAKEGTVAIAEAIEEEIGEEAMMPVLIQGDFNRTPSEIRTIKK